MVSNIFSSYAARSSIRVYSANEYIIYDEETFKYLTICDVVTQVKKKTEWKGKIDKTNTQRLRFSYLL